jgi:DNA-binding transcriptional regulator GbsR (MarR family)
MNTISISEIQRNLHKLEGLDIVEVVDKKRHQVKGYFLDKKYHDVVQALVDSKEKETADKLSQLKKLSQNVTVLEDKTTDLCKIDEEMYRDIF